MDAIYWVVLLLGFSLVGIGLRFAHNFAENEEKKNSIHEMALKWKAMMEENAIQQNDQSLNQ